MSMMTDKTMLAAGLVFILLSGGLSVLSTGGVEDAVLEATETKPLDDIVKILTAQKSTRTGLLRQQNEISMVGPLPMSMM